MSIRRQIQYRLDNVTRYFSAFTLPSWLDSIKFRVSLMVLIFVFGAAYIAKTTSSASSGFELQKYEKQVNVLSDDIDSIKVQIADLSSVNNIHGRVEKMNMVVADNIKYISIKEDVVAKN